MNRFLRIVALSVAIGIVLALVSFGVRWTVVGSGEPTPADFIAVARKEKTTQTQTTEAFLNKHLQTVEWQALPQPDGGTLVEARGNLRSDGKPVVLRWRIVILKEMFVTTTLANIQTATLDGTEIVPATAYVQRLSMTSPPGDRQ